MRAAGVLATVMALAAGPGYAQTPDLAENPPVELTEDKRQCLARFFPADFEMSANEKGYQIRDAVFGLLFARDLQCAQGRLDLQNVVLLGEPIRAGQPIGSAMKADVVTLWAPPVRAGCSVPVDYGVEITNFRWFNWNDTTTDGGNKRFEVITTGEGKEVRISTMSHLRTSGFIWTPNPDLASSPCALSGNFNIKTTDVRWSRGGTASGILVDDLRGSFNLSLFPDDAKRTKTAPGLEVSASGVSLTDITESVTARFPILTGKAELSPESALPWAFFIKKYARDLIYRHADDSLLLRVFPVDMANTFHFTKGVMSLSVPRATLTTAAFLPSSLGYALGTVNMSSVFATAEMVVGLNARDPGKFKMNAQVDGVGRGWFDIDFRTQLFGKDHLKAVSEGAIDLRGKTGPGITDAEITFEDLGFTNAFVSMMKSNPSTFVVRNNNGNMTFWQQIGKWFSLIEQGKTGTVAVDFEKPQVMLEGFWQNAPAFARVTVQEGQ